jgi:hypothetical protein
LKHLLLDYDIEGIPGYFDTIQTDILPKGLWNSDRVSIVIDNTRIKLYYTHKLEVDDLDKRWASWLQTGRYLTPFTKEMQEIVDEVTLEWKDKFPHLLSVSESDCPIILDFIWDKYRNYKLNKE